MYQVLDSEGKVQLEYSSLRLAVSEAILFGFNAVRTEQGVTVYNLSLLNDVLKLRE